MGDVKRRVLVVDDELKFVKLLSEQLSLVGFEVAVAMDGETALMRALEDPPPDLIILDVILPKLDGYRVCTQLKQDHRTRHIPIIMLTVKGEKEDYQKGIACGAEAYLVKPFQREALEEMVNRLVKTLLTQQSHAQEAPGDRDGTSSHRSC